VTPPASPTPRAAGPAGDHRQRLLDGLAQVLSERSYTELTIADIVAAAHVSRRTFYEHFEGKEACLLALCERLSTEVLVLIAQGYDPLGDWVEQLHQVTTAYLQSLQAQPALVKSLYLELMAIGPTGLAMRRRIGQRFAQFLIMQVELSKAREPGKRSLSPALATAVVGGINELILQAIEEGRADRLSELAPTVSEFVQAVLQSLEPAAPDAA
jgi:AcrR family transcriptional regulator